MLSLPRCQMRNRALSSYACCVTAPIQAILTPLILQYSRSYGRSYHSLSPAPSKFDPMTKPALPIPSSHLPHIKTLPSCCLDELRESLQYIREIYNPGVKGSRIKSRHRIFPRRLQSPTSTRERNGVGPHNHDSEDITLDDLRSDQFERAYVLRWLTALISQQADAEPNPASCNPTAHEQIMQEAASLLAICSGTAGAGTISRVFAFLSPRNKSSGTAGEPISVQLNDIPLENHDYSSVGAQTWGGACVLSELLVAEPERFGLAPESMPASPRGLRVLELGAGTGLVGLTVGKVLRQQDRNHPPLVLATDFYPSVLANLAENALVNFPPHESHQSVQFETHFLDWSQHAALDSASVPPFDHPFDVVFGADIIYEADHAKWIKQCLHYLLRKPTPAEASGLSSPPTFHLVIPLRPTHHFESSTVETVFQLQPDNEQTADTASLELYIVSKDVILCAGSLDDSQKGEDVEYSYYQIQWCAA
ncbi:hypothetical protein HGRIS_006102 [Hohenbuehelia grisea]|uniref:Uncharacterized protein n=1 Tax=Hohenbuehelia grisea TaxID=104357 RepID=A0ABR3JYU1_9AGAR